MPFRKKALYYGLMLFLTLLAVEGMARIAYYAAYGQGYGHGPAALPAAAAPILDQATHPWQIRHPLYVHTWNFPGQDLNTMPPRQRREDTVVIGLLGGSVAENLEPVLQSALNRWFAANNLPRQPVVLRWAVASAKQPRQVNIVANTLLLGGEFDLLVNLDGRNELAETAGRNLADGIFPFFPIWWDKWMGPTTEELLLAGQIGVLRREQARLRADAATAPLRHSAVFGLAHRWRQERTAQRISQRNRQLAALRSDYSLEKHGPRNWRATEAELLPAAARLWYRGSVALAQLAQLGGAEYYHFLQPNQYVPDAKPLSAEELAAAYAPRQYYQSAIARGYPLLQQFSRDLPRHGVNYFDLTGIFLDHPETLYIDECCHLNDRGKELLAAAMIRRMEPELRRLGGETLSPPVSALDAARRPTKPDALLVNAYFRVYLQENPDNQLLRYVREDCAAADAEPRFFLHLTPHNLADLPAHRREQGFDNRDFSFAEVDGRRWRGQCRAQIPLPDYPIAYLRTGQYTPAGGEFWAGDFYFLE